MGARKSAFRSLPSMDGLLRSGHLAAAVAGAGQDSVKEEAAARLESLRRRIAADDRTALAWIASERFAEELCAEIAGAVDRRGRSSLAPVFNLTGTVLHTNLGRAPLAPEAVRAMAAAAGAVNLEFDLDAGRRGERDDHVRSILCELTGAEAAAAVNNNAAAVLLALNTLAAGRDALVSRGELVEIGGSFRIPDVMRSAGCRLREVGSTNRTHLSDYESAIGGETALIMKVHTSNYEIRGFTKAAPPAELAALARSRGLPLVHDLGSGTLVDLARLGLPREPTVREALEAGADLVTFSGDKLLGGPQAGLIAGRRDLVERLRRNPLRRALRIDKTAMAALAATLGLYRDPRRLAARLPLLADLARPADEIRAACERLAPALRERLRGVAEVTVEPCRSQVGSGSLPLERLDSCALALVPAPGGTASDAALTGLARAFRMLPRPVIGRVHDGRLLFDLRCLRDEKGFAEQLGALEAPPP